MARAPAAVEVTASERHKDAIRIVARTRYVAPISTIVLDPARLNIFVTPGKQPNLL
jgi:hypothetical protein